MARPRLEPGEIGAIQIRALASGRVQATAKMRDEVGELRRLKATGDTEDEAAGSLKFETIEDTDGLLERRL